MMKFVIFAVLVACCIAAVVSSLPGGYSEVDVDDESVVKAAHFANQALGKQFSTPYHTKLTRVHKAEKQVVAGMNYKMTVFVGLTNCKKAEVDYDDIEGCEYQDNVSTYRKCYVVVYHNLKDEYKLTSSGCILAGKDEI